MKNNDLIEVYSYDAIAKRLKSLPFNKLNWVCASVEMSLPGIIAIAKQKNKTINLETAIKFTRFFKENKI
jgi:hypothetical protein